MTSRFTWVPDAVENPSDPLARIGRHVDTTKLGEVLIAATVCVQRGEWWGRCTLERRVTFPGAAAILERHEASFHGRLDRRVTVTREQLLDAAQAIVDARLETLVGMATGDAPVLGVAS